MERYLKEKGRSEKLADWQFRQMVDALRILREADIEQALAGFSDPGPIPERNIRTMQKPGAEWMRAILAGCLKIQV